MCGIAGMFGNADRGASTRAVERMLSTLRRRGPDAAGIKRWDRAVLGHRRLAIFDLSDAGRQPMVSADGTVGVAFNGAIYNFKGLRAELQQRGHVFRSATDTEVLVEGYRAWGIDTLVERIQGMFAFALWDDSHRRLYLVRDRLGVKPVAFATTNGGLAFASTPRALRAGGIAPSLDVDAIAEFLEFGFVTEDRSIYEAVEKLPAATILEWCEGEPTRSRRYWSPPASASGSSISFSDAVHETERLLLRAVEARLQADVPVGALLSGGIDSALVCWALKHLGAEVTAFTVGTSGDPTDETRDAVATARELGLRHQVLQLSPNDGVDLETLSSAYAEPFACASALGMLRVSRAVAGNDVKVLLTGDGGDDVFLGYPRHRHLLAAQRVAAILPEVASPLWRLGRAIAPTHGMLGRIGHFVDYAVGGLGAFTQAHDGLPGFARRGLLGERLHHASVRQRRIPWSLTAGRRVLVDYLDYDLRTQFVAEYLTKVDGATMYHSLEARSPFFDQELWSYASSLPFGTRLHGGQLKAILRALATRRISARVAQGRKRGFNVPVERWLAGPRALDVEARLSDSLLVRDGWIDGATLKRELSSRPLGARPSHHLWYLLVLENWMQREATSPPSHPERILQGDVITA